MALLTKNNNKTLPVQPNKTYDPKYIISIMYREYEDGTVVSIEEYAEDFMSSIFTTNRYHCVADYDSAEAIEEFIYNVKQLKGSILSFVYRYKGIDNYNDRFFDNFMSDYSNKNKNNSKIDTA